MNDFLISLWNFVLISAPYLMIGLLISGIVHQYLSVEIIKKHLSGKGSGSVIKASAVGVPLPLCSCSVIPASVTLKKAGASNGATSAFLISTPESGIDSMAMTYGLMDLPMTIIRPFAAFVSALFAGLLQNSFNDEEVMEMEEDKPCCSKKKVEERGAISALRYGFFTLLQDLSIWLTIGIIVGAMINYFVPESFFETLSGGQAKLLILAIGIPFYICASATTPIAASLILKGMSPGTALLLLLVGPATNISNILVMQKYIGKKGVAINVFSIIMTALLFSFATDWGYSFFDWNLDFKLAGHDHEHTNLFITIVSILFTVLLFRGLFLELKSKIKGHSH